MKIVIPLQTCSTRIPRKNIRPFYKDDSLFDIKAKQILAFEAPENVYVSSESEEVCALCDKYGFHFMPRDPALTGNKVFQPDLVKALTDPIPGDDDIMWIQVTSPLFNQFTEALEVWEKVRDEYDSLVAVKPFKGHLLDEKGNPVNYAFGYWHKVSQELPKLHSVLWSLFILKRATVNRFHYHIGVKPYLFETHGMVVDIDYHDDFELASLIYEKIHSVVE
ncbi:glycosyltransferase family protein [Pseudothauera rhizosphaerae]|uniref:CMP-N-acetylneuraminic acid synthetase n=1 Tax=Pseudothauera rhizosphaerae TaxID=2565932 RepID=A0A4S4AER2_9RHOO|nr:CMP-N-acetylneuraminic acid synthetase [Pseudothauera rhizosphaerae]THF57660.1 CMP-N-acetylneuraminic acid synthetase [Pseudothauera rhizosphaerae]